jgi:hypothetical protein
VGGRKEKERRWQRKYPSGVSKGGGKKFSRFFFQKDLAKISATAEEAGKFREIFSKKKFPRNFRE